MTRHLFLAATVGWLARRLLALLTFTLSLLAPPQTTSTWMACLGGGGGVRIERTLEIADRNPAMEVWFVGSGPEMQFARSLARQHPTVRARYLTVEPATTYACLAALAKEAGGPGTFVTSRDHAPRVRLTWSLLAPMRPTPGLVATGRCNPDGLELLKTAFYLLRY